MPTWIDQGCQDYLKRINRGQYVCKLIDIKAERKANKSPLENMAAEAKKFQGYLSPTDYLIVLDEHGKNYSSVDFAQLISQISQNFSQINLLIGGDAGTHPELKKQANTIISLSAMVFPHALVRLIMLEQIYRAISILENHPYHRI